MLGELWTDRRVGPPVRVAAPAVPGLTRSHGRAISMSATVLRHGIPGASQYAKVRKPRRPARLRVEPLEPRDVPTATLALDFNTNSSPTPSGYAGEKPVLHSATNPYG